MLSQETLDRLVHAISNEEIALDISRSIINSSSEVWGDESDTQALVDSFVTSDEQIEEYCTVAFADADAGEEFSKKIILSRKAIRAILNAWDAEDQLAVEASYSDTLAGTATPVTIEAVTAGEAGNDILLEFDGILTISEAIDAWNLANPENEAVLSAGDGNQVPDNAVTAQLSGGQDAEQAPENTERDAILSELAQESNLSDRSLEFIVQALASEDAGNELKDALIKSAVEIVD